MTNKHTCQCNDAKNVITWVYQTSYKDILWSIVLTTCNVQHHAGIIMCYCVFDLWNNISLHNIYSCERFKLHCLFVWTVYFRASILLKNHFTEPIRLNISLRSVYSSEQFILQCPFVWSFHFAVLFVWTFNLAMSIRLKVSLCTVYRYEQFTLQCLFVWTSKFALSIRLNISLRSVYSPEHMKSGS